MTRIFTRLILATALIVALPVATTAQTALTTGKPTTFKVTVTKVELYNGSAFVTIFSGSSQLDLVSAAGVSAFPGISNLTLPAGTYSQIRVTFTNSFSMQGSLTYGGTTYYTTATTLQSGSASQASTSASALAEVAISNPDWGTASTGVVQTMTITPVTVTSTTTYAPTIKFGVTNSLVLSSQSGVFFFTLTGVSVSIV